MKWVTLEGVACLVIGGVLFSVIVVVSGRAAQLFVPKYGRRHRVMGAVYLFWLTCGVSDLLSRFIWHCGDDRSLMHGKYAYFDVILGIAGILLTLSAADDFKHQKNKVRGGGKMSGTLSEVATVTRAEMMEHSFYQALNLLQALFLHATHSLALSQWCASIVSIRLALLFAVTSPWLLRPLFPVHPFSANYDPKQGGGDPWLWVNVLYRIKKYQYLFYKHFFLHGLNIAVSLQPRVMAKLLLNSSTGHPLVAPSALDPSDAMWRAFWLGLNAAYVMEFFLQTLVRRGYLSQQKMLASNQLLMLGSSAAAVAVLRLQYFGWVRSSAVDQISSGGAPLAGAVASWVLNFLRRGREVTNVALASAVAVGYAATATV